MLVLIFSWRFNKISIWNIVQVIIQNHQDHLSNHKTINVWDSRNNLNVHGYTGTIFAKYPFGAVPHPQSHISTEVRKAFWQNVVKDNPFFLVDYLKWFN